MKRLRASGARKRALRQTEETFRSLIENASDIITVISADATIIFESPSVEHVTGFTPEELAGKNGLDFVHPEDRMRVASIIQELVKASGEAMARLEFRFLRKDGTYCILESIGQTIRNDKKIQIVVNSRDMTERVRMEEQLRQSHRLEVVGQLAGGVAHDFNNLLTIILGYTTILLQSYKPNHPTFAKVSEIRSAAERGAALTRQLLLFSRKHVFNVEPLDLNAIVVNVEKLLRRLIGEDVTLVIQLDFSLKWIKADLGQIEQILMNLAVNAREAMAHAGELRITTENVCLTGSEPLLPRVSAGNFVMLRVADTGCGMTKDIQEHVFEPFFTTKAAGTGLGLSTVYGIVQHSGGAISLTSEMGHGSVFTVYFPAIDSPIGLTAKPSDTLESQRTSPSTVLLVEDEQIVREVVKNNLTHKHYNVLEAATAEDAVAVAKEYAEPIDLLLTDVVLPGTGGIELSSRIKSIRPEITVLLMSGYGPEVFNLGQDIPFLQKPFTPEALERKIRKTMTVGNLRN